jgi:cell division protein FtsW (lipid II flippase)
MGLARRFASRMLSAASCLLPPHLSPWARAMGRELAEIPDDGAALVFAAGCLRAVLALAVTARLRSLLAAFRAVPIPLAPSIRSLLTMNSISARPRWLGFICGVGAVGMGIAYMSAAGAPSRYILMNLAALVLGATAWLALGRAAGSRLAGAGPVTLALALALLLTALFGFAVEGASRWVSLGPLNLQVSLIVLPVMLVLYARRPDAVGTVGMMVAALALALQPDRAMAGVLAAGLLALLVSNRSGLPIVAAAGAIFAFGWTLLSPDLLPAVPYVDRILYTAFEIHLLAGLAVVIGAAALVVPAVMGAWRSGSERSALLAFGGCWSGMVVAAALGNYPTPLVGYGGSAVLGYLLSAALLPNGPRENSPLRAPLSPPVDGRSSDHPISELRAARLA